MRDIRFRAWDGKQMFPVSGISWREIFGAGEPERFVRETVQAVDKGDYPKPNWQVPSEPWPDFSSEEAERRWENELKQAQKEHDEALKNLVLMEFTGLKDKNGKEIWEGDVVAFRNDISPQPYGNYPDPGEERSTLAEVWYDEPLACFSIRNATEKNVGEYPVSQIQDEYGEFEVIGNIWENPELLKGEK